MDRLKSVLLFLALFAPCAISLKLSIANICILPAILLFLYLSHGNVTRFLTAYRSTTIPLLAFVFVALYSSFFGLDIQESLIHVVKISFMLLLIPLYSAVAREGYTQTVLTSITLGLVVASLHTVYEGAYPGALFEYSHGPVSEAGQLAIGIFCVIALFSLSREHLSKARLSDIPRYSILPCLGFLILGFSNLLHLSALTKHILATACIVYVAWYGFRLFRSFRDEGHIKELYIFTLCVGLPLLTSGLLLNLKRGPWVGTLSALFLLLAIRKPKLLLPTIPLALLVLFGFEPIRVRAFSSLEHFFTVGGRGEIWALGGELLIRYPLGIGLENAGIIKDFSHDIPANLNHFHSNTINVAVELGWLGLVTYLWWIAAIIRKGTYLQDSSTAEGMTTVCLTCAVIAWQVAGLFEYNFGDSEVFLLALMVIGLVVGAPVTAEEPIQPSSAVEIKPVLS